MARPTHFAAVRVLDRASPFDGQAVDLLLDDGHVAVNPSRVPDEAERVRVDGLCVSPGWVDIGPALNDPGHEERETVDQLLAAAAAGGYTRVVCFGETLPALDNVAAVRGALDRARAPRPAGLGVVGALSQGGAGKQLAEIGEMAAAGLRLFGDGLHPIDDPKLLQLALAYAQPFGATVVAQPGERRLDGAGQMHEGAVSTMLGLPGLPAIAEAIGLERDLQLLGYRGGRLHLFALTLAASVRAAAVAKTRYAGLTYGVSALHLLLDEGALLGYDVNCKVRPPLREPGDREALVAAVRAGEADALVSNHRPYDVERKRVEFPYAAFGAASLELAYAVAQTAVGDEAVVADYLGRRNRALAGLPAPTIDDGAAAELTFFAPGVRWRVPPRPLVGGGVNVPLVGKSLSGFVVGTYFNRQWQPRPPVATPSVLT